MNDYQIVAPVLITKKEAAKRLGRSISSFNKYVLRKPGFPEKIKDGDHRQSPVYYVDKEIVNWINGLMAIRGGAK